MNNYYRFGRIISTIIMAMILRIAPWPDFIATINPDWVLLTLIYWTLAIPERVGIFHAWTFGLLTDVLTGRSFGQYALTYSLVSYVCIKLHKRLRPFPLIQQELFIFLFLLLSQLLLFWIKNLQTPGQLSASFWLPVVSGTLCWPIVYKSLRFIRLLRSNK
ncbi:rod shape-determining protein MreD [Crenothrix sp.]|jgi:rod shape-determining protein MreD|uniref:rod shape-determining protein MreD n=1 Tax=Crenothrix sp. TaxID=3100433 RepID=UPI00374C8C24